MKVFVVVDTESTGNIENIFSTESEAEHYILEISGEENIEDAWNYVIQYWELR